MGLQHSKATAASCVEMSDGVGLAADEVVQSVGQFGVNEALPTHLAILTLKRQGLSSFQYVHMEQ